MTEKKSPPQAGKVIPFTEANRAARVKAVREAIDAGTYRIDNRDLADSILSDILWEQWERIRFFKP